MSTPQIVLLGLSRNMTATTLICSSCIVSCSFNRIFLVQSIRYSSLCVLSSRLKCCLCSMPHSSFQLSSFILIILFFTSLVVCPCSAGHFISVVCSSFLSCAVAVQQVWCCAVLRHLPARAEKQSSVCILFPTLICSSAFLVAPFN